MQFYINCLKQESSKDLNGLEVQKGLDEIDTSNKLFEVNLMRVQKRKPKNQKACKETSHNSTPDPQNEKPSGLEEGPNSNSKESDKQQQLHLI